MEVHTKNGIDYLLQTLSSPIKGRCDVVHTRDKQGKRVSICTNFRHDESEVIWHLLGVGFSDCAYHIQSKSGNIKCYDKDNNFLGTKEDLERILKSTKITDLV